MAENEGSKSPAEQDAHQEKHGVGSVLAEFIGSHKVLLIGAIAGFAIVAFIMSKSKSTSAGTTSDATNQQGSLAGYQNTQTANSIDQLTQSVNNMLSAIQGKLNPAPTPAPTSTWKAPLIPYGQLPAGTQYSTAAQLKANPWVTWQGVKYWKVPGSGNILWGISPTGEQVKLYGNANAYVPPVTTAQANHSPIYSFLPLGQTSGGMDLGHPGVAGSPMQGVRPVARVGHTWSEGIGASGTDSVYIGRS